MTPADSAALAAAEIARCAAIALATWGITVTPRVTWTLTGTRRLHAYVSKPDAVAGLITRALKGAT
jgi:hypothetical protein